MGTGRRFLTTAWVSAAVAVLALVLGSGCASSSSSPSKEPTSGARDFEKPLSPSNQELARGTLAAVEIHGHDVVTIRETIDSVFTGAGFQEGRTQPELRVYERPASRRLVATYGSWGGIEVRVRLKVEITPQNSGVYFLRCRSYIVREPGSMAEGEQSLARRHVREYESLLHEVAARLN